MPTRTILHNLSFGQIPSIGPGDPDVNSQSGRSTDITLELSNLSIASNSTEISVQLLYSVEELHKDSTKLELRREVRIPIPASMRNPRIAGTRDFRNEWTISGKVHNWINITSNQVDSCLESGSFKFDGSGRDDQGNARLRLTLRVNVAFD